MRNKARQKRQRDASALKITGGGKVVSPFDKFNLIDSLHAQNQVSFITHRAIKHTEGCLWFLKERKKNEMRHSYKAV